MRESLGFVECDGLSSALVAADRMLKTAAVKLEGMHETMGIGWVTVKIAGDISAVQAAVDEVKASMPKVVIASVVLGSPAPGINGLGNTDIGIFLPPTPPDNEPVAPKKKANETVNASAETEKPQKQADNVSLSKQKTDESSTDEDESSAENKPLSDGGEVKNNDSQSHEDGKMKGESSDNDSSSTDDQEVVTCNLCGDPKCPRKKGEPHKKCIHYDELKKNK